MPTAHRKPCSHPGCIKLAASSYCDEHIEKRRIAELERQRTKHDLYDAEWRRESKEFLKRNRWCIEHLAIGEVVAATVTDHRVPHRGDRKRFWDRTNWQPLCKHCHDRKTAREDSAWARGF